MRLQAGADKLENLVFSKKKSTVKRRSLLFCDLHPAGTTNPIWYKRDIHQQDGTD